MENKQASDFAKVLRFRDVVVFGIVVVALGGPWGTFAFVYDLANGAAALAYLIGMAAMFLTAWSYKQMADAISGPGSAYAYARAAMGPRAGFMTGWMVLLDYILLPALLFVMAAVALTAFIPAVPRAAWVVLLAAYSLGVNWFGIRMAGRVNLIMVVVQLFMVLAWLVGAFAALGWSLPAMLPADALWNDNVRLPGLFTATSICILAFLGFDAVTTLSEEMLPERRHLLGWAVPVVLLICGGFSILQGWVMSAIADGYIFRDLASGVVDMTHDRISEVGGVVMAWSMAAMIGVGVAPPTVAAGARVLQAMGAARQLPPFLGNLHPRWQVPNVALLVTIGISALIALFFVDYVDQLTSIVNFGALSAFCSVHLAVIVLLFRKRTSGRIASHLVVPVAGIILILSIASQMNVTALALGAIWVCLGVIRLLLMPGTAREAVLEV